MHVLVDKLSQFSFKHLSTEQLNISYHNLDNTILINNVKQKKIFNPKRL